MAEEHHVAEGGGKVAPKILKGHIKVSLYTIMGGWNTTTPQLARYGGMEVGQKEKLKNKIYTIMLIVFNFYCFIIFMWKVWFWKHSVSLQLF